MPNQRPINSLINPLLTLISVPRRESITGGGKNAVNIKRGRLQEQRRLLAAMMSDVSANAATKSILGHAAIAIEMWSDSYSPSYAPKDLFGAQVNARLIAPFKNGYLAEIKIEQIPAIINLIKTTDRVPCLVDISRVKKIEILTDTHVLNGIHANVLMERATKITVAGMEFAEYLIWLVPFSRHALRIGTLSSLATTIGIKGIIATPTDEAEVTDELDERSLIALPSHGGHLLATNPAGRLLAPIYSIALETTDQLLALAASGKVIRIDPVTTIAPADASIEGITIENMHDLTHSPIVGVIDGGRTARSYDYAEAWRGTNLVDTSVAHTSHGNGVSSLVVHGHELNRNLNLPKLFCRIGTAQVLASPRFPHKSPHPKAVIKYLDEVIAQNPETKIWNISANTNDECDDFAVSPLGHAIGALARKYNILPIISAGNKLETESLRIAPPSDCEAGLIVAGRKHDEHGHVGAPCPKSRLGLGPDEMLKPDLSWFSTVKVLGNQGVNGTSFSTPLVSSLAAHTWKKLKDPSPDLVKAVLLSNCDLKKYDSRLGWGSPVETENPWECEEGTVTLAWRSELKTGLTYYWDKIAVPTTLLDNGALHGHISLTAILDPTYLNFVGVGNYCMSRLEVSLQDSGMNEDDDASNVLGSMQKRLTEYNARKIDHKWSPIRRHANNFKGKALRASTLRLRARIYTRDLWQLGISAHDLSNFDVGFVLKFMSSNRDPNTYRSFVQAMRQQVESAIVDQTIEVENQ